MSLLAIAVPMNALGQQNLEWGRSTSMWGFPRRRAEYDFIAPGATILLGTDYHHPTLGSNPRKPFDVYRQGWLGRVLVFRADSFIRTASTPHWPDEIAEQRVKYPERIAMTFRYEMGLVDLATAPEDFAKAFHRSINSQGAGVAVADSPYTLAIERDRSADLGEAALDAGALVIGMSADRIAALAARGEAHAELAFWSPVSEQGAPPKLRPSEPILFGPVDSSGESVRVSGGGVLGGVVRLRLSELWEDYREDCGATSLADLRAQYGQQVDARAAVDDPDVEVMLAHDVRVFAPGEEVDVPIAAVPFVLERGQYFKLDGDAAEPILRAVLSYFSPEDRERDDEVTQVVIASIAAKSRQVMVRLGQKGFSALIAKNYGYACALTGTKVRPVLEAAHIKDFARSDPGEAYRRDNGILLKVDAHRLYDRGLISFDARGGLVVSPQLREKYGNGDWYYERERAGHSLRLPDQGRDRPNSEFLEWHHEVKFLG